MNTAACIRPGERGAGLVLLPVLSTLLFYLAPLRLQESIFLQFLPQGLAYAGLVIWIALNTHIAGKFGLEPERFVTGAAWGVAIGLLLGTINIVVILKVVPWLGLDITFLRQTPHARIPFWLMMPWFIVLIACFVEINFRGFLLGRLLALGLPSTLAIAASAVLFAFDPFMVATFKHLHWIAVWDGLVWGMLWIRLRNLYATVVAHAVEVILMYNIVRAALG
ncbi:MAG: CPBP family glutamic-type intramembrane protease [Nitrospiraceae bacterium]